MHHSGRGGYLDPTPRPDGTPFLELTVHEVATAIRKALEPDLARPQLD
jgi:hypothetical protein